MIYSFYFRFYKMVQCRWLCAVLSYMAYTVWFFKYLGRRLFIKHRIVRGSTENALDLVRKVHPDPGRPVSQEPEEYHGTVDLSVIIPVYNYAELIRENIESMLDQKTGFSYELIFVDDGSTDGSGDILKEYADRPEIRLIFQENRGIAGARNTGLDHAAGKYVMFADCDDIAEPDLVETLMSRAYRDDCDIVMCAHTLTKERNGQIRQRIPNIYPEYNLMGYDRDARILNYAGLPWCKAYKRELWEQVRFFSGYWYEDCIIHGLIFPQCGKFAYVPKVCYRYRWYENNYSHIQGQNNDPRCLDIYWLMKRILERYEELSLPKNAYFETMLLKHLSAYYFSKISGMEEDVLEAMFILACDLYGRYGIKGKCRLPYMLRVTKKALEKGDINLWKTASVYQK